MDKLGVTADPIVAFVGAGASAMPPSNLPTWNQFNTLLLESLCERLAAYSGDRQPTTQMLGVFHQRRDRTQFFAPDFQAQLIEDEIGKEYFKVWRSLEPAEFGPVHQSLAELAARGALAAIVTVNFDRLIEAALTARKVKFDVWHDAARFDSLPARLETETTCVPVIKLHGSIEDSDSLVDTLRQRVSGRPPELMQGLAMLLRRHHWVFLGFSGADFSYNLGYLGIMGEAERAQGFVFVSRPGSSIQKGVLAIAAAYGPRKASIVVGDAAEYLPLVHGVPASDRIAAAKSDDVTEGVRVRIREWVDGLGPMSAVNVLCALLRSTGLENQATWLLRKTWRNYRSPEDLEHGSYPRYNYNYGIALFQAGLMGETVALAEDMSNLLEWKADADQNAFQFLARAYYSGKLPVAGVALSSLMACRGEVSQAIALCAKATDEAIATDDPLAVCDAAIASVPLYDIVQFFQGPVRQLRLCLTRAEKAGDEPRRAMLYAQLGRLLTYQGSFAEADEALGEADRIAKRLDLRSVLMVCRAARGLWLADSATSAESAVSMLSELAEELRERDEEPLVTKVDLYNPDAPPTVIKGTDPLRCRILLDLSRAALFVGDGVRLNETLDALDELTTTRFTGYRPHYYISYVQCILSASMVNEEEGPTLMRELLDRARWLGEEQGNPWVRQATEHLEAQAAPA
jgi:tetratricopeptide (TPR) repeat protein